MIRSIISDCLNLFPCAKYLTAKGGIKANVSLAEASMIPDIVNTGEAKVSDQCSVDDFRYVKDIIIGDDRGYFDVKLFKIRIEDDAISKILMVVLAVCPAKSAKWFMTRCF